MKKDVVAEIRDPGRGVRAYVEVRLVHPARPGRKAKRRQRVVVGYCGAEYDAEACLRFLEEVQREADNRLTQADLRKAMRVLGVPPSDLVWTGSDYRPHALLTEIRAVRDGESGRPKDFSQALEEHLEGRVYGDWYGLVEQLLAEGLVG